MTKQKREYKKHLVRLTNAICSFEHQMDELMKLPSTQKRGEHIAKLMNDLSIENQAVMRYALGRTWNHIDKIYAAASGAANGREARSELSNWCR